jgi:hypothetical protein
MAVTLSEDVVPDAERRTTYQAMHDELLGFIDREDVEQQLILAGD